ncbi:hypothetical protein [Aquimarina sp. AU119]|uniref:hypothetical protein n=1 Tax=Aquimarina sp. AU119 TaxID=2108528 RepID=UPI000D69E6EB|nr:hypothetical protein [Aquimarina sp. AU119]
MTTADLTSKSKVTTGNDSIVIMRNLGDIPGGRTLDVTGFAPDVISAGHVIIKETSSGEFKPMPVNGSAYDALPSGHTYEGVLVASIEKSKPFAAIMDRGDVLEPASPYPPTSAIKTALSLIKFKTE